MQHLIANKQPNFKGSSLKIGQQNIIMIYRKKLSLNSMSPQDKINLF